MVLGVYFGPRRVIFVLAIYFRLSNDRSQPLSLHTLPPNNIDTTTIHHRTTVHQPQHTNPTHPSRRQSLLHRKYRNSHLYTAPALHTVSYHSHGTPLNHRPPTHHTTLTAPPPLPPGEGQWR